MYFVVQCVTQQVLEMLHHLYPVQVSDAIFPLALYCELEEKGINYRP